MRNSLVVRSFLATSVVSIVAFAVAGTILVTMYRGALVRSFDKRLEVYLKTLIGEAADIEGEADKLVNPGNLGEPRFGFPLSGWYWAILDKRSGKQVFASASLQGEPLAAATKAVPAKGLGGGLARGHASLKHRDITGPEGKDLRIAHLDFSLSETQLFTAVVAGDIDEITREIHTFGGQIAAMLFALGVGLVLTTYFQVRYGLQPLRRIRVALFAIRSGRANSLRGAFADELQPLVDEMNALIGSNREILERSRTQVGNLAHALKTPLSVLRNEAANHQGSFADKVVEQSDLMNDQVSLYLDRARFAAKRNVIGVATEAAPVVRSLARAMDQIHRDRNLEIDVSVPDGLYFRGERQDLEEMIGNLMDNACKWAGSKLRVIARPQVSEDGRRRIVVVIDDDGPGLDEADIERAMGRGERLDESTPGSGLGLSIVSELAQSYGGSISLGASPLGGLSCELELPAAQM